MKHEASRMQFLLTLGLLVFGVSILIGIFLIARFFLRRPPPFFARFLETIPVEKRGVLLESAILYLFLVFPAGMVIQRFIPARMQVEFQVIYTVLSAVVALWYFRSEAGLRMLVQTLWIPVVVSPSAEEPGKPAGSEPVPSDAKGPTALMVVRAWAPIGREILYGVGAALIFLPPLMMRSAAGAIMGEGQFEFRFVNPTVLPGDGRFWLLMIFAVGIIPVIEEMVMHNWLYGALRFRFSVLFSAILTGVFCAALQPPGWWPFLMIPGAGLALLREFRPGLVAPVVAHSLLNAFTVLAGLGLSLM